MLCCNYKKKEINLIIFGGLDQADLSLLQVLLKEAGTLITNDGGLFTAAKDSNKRALFLPEFLLLLNRNGNLKKNLTHKALKYWEKTERFGKSELKNWFASLQQIK